MPASVDHPTRTRLDGSATARLAAASLLLMLCLVAGGSSQQSGTGLLVAQALSLPLIAWAGWHLLHQRLDGTRLAWLLFAGAVLAIPLLQAWLPAAVAGSGAGRAGLSADLALFGVETPARWSLAPVASLDAALYLLPALAVLGLSLGLPSAAQRVLAQVIMALAMASLVLGIAQLGAPQESPLNPYPQWKPAMNGFFANPNHQATLLVVAATLACARLVMTLGAWPSGRPHRILHAVASALVILLAVAALPLTGSRAGVVLVILASALVVAAHWPAWRSGRRSRWILLATLAVAAVGLSIALRWMQVDAVDELRGPLRAVTTDIAARYAPLGAGVGSYVPVFEQEAPRAMLMGNYVNHAHNEYAQWWLEAGGRQSSPRRWACWHWR